MIPQCTGFMLGWCALQITIKLAYEVCEHGRNKIVLITKVQDYKHSTIVHGPC